MAQRKTKQGINPYARPVPEDGEAPDPSGNYTWGGPGQYSVADPPDSTDPDYTLGFSPVLRPSPDGSTLPDDIRVGLREPPENDPNDAEYNRRRWSDFHQRHSDERTVTGWNVHQQKVQAPIVPEWTQERLPVRPTADDSPLGYQFTRPWHIPRHVQDAVGEEATIHFSMADHRRTFPIMGMKPQGRIGVNTYRAEPRPWDEELFVPPRAGEGGNEVSTGNQAYRL